MKKREDLFCSILNLKLYVGTWNLGGARLPAEHDIKSWLFPFKENFIP